MAESNNKNNTNSASDSAKTNVIDFTTRKLQQLVKQFEGLGDYYSAKQVEDCLEAHKAGEIDIIWRDGLPFVKIKPTKPA